MHNPQEWAQLIAVECEANGTVERAEFEQGYLKTELTFFGNTVPFLRGVAKRFLKAHPNLSRDDTVALVDELFASRNHNLCQTATFVLCGRKEVLRAADAPWLQGLIQQAHTWAIVDHLASECLGSLVERFPSVAKALPRWSRHDDFWVRRSALLAHLVPLRRGEGNFDGFAALAVPLLGETEFFIRKAIGWVLREASKQQPERVAAFLREHAGAMSGLTLREGMKRLPTATQQALRSRQQKASGR